MSSLPPPAEVRTLLEKIARVRLLVIGDVMLDHYIWGDATRISPEAPVPVVHQHRESDTAGGAANVAANAASLGAKVELVGAIGRDAHGRKLLAHLDSLKIAFDRRMLQPGPTITKTRVIVRNQQLCRIDTEAEPRTYRTTLGTPAAVERLAGKIRRADGVILSDYAKGVLTTDLIAQVTRLAHQRDGFVSLDPKPSGGNESSGVDLLTPNHKEALELAGLPPGSDGAAEDTAICRRIWERYRPRHLVVTLGAEGMLLSERGRLGARIPTAAREVYDVSGAGDTVIAALTLAMTVGATMEAAARFANAAAGVVVGKLGTATVSPAELVAYVSQAP